MKKLFFSLITATALLSFASCGNPVEDKAKEYCEQLLNAKTAVEAGKIISDSDKWYEGLSEEDKKVADEVMKTYEAKIKAKMSE